MQAATAAAIGVDAFYAAVKDRIHVPERTARAWRKNGTARHRQIAEVLRLGFVLTPRVANQMRTVLHDIMRFRDQAVHPSGSLGQPHLHPELQRGMEWRFVTFRFTLVKTVVSLAVSLVAQLLFVPRSKHTPLVAYCDGLKPEIVPLLHRLERRYGPLFVRDPTHKGPPVEDGAV